MIKEAYFKILSTHGGRSVKIILLIFLQGELAAKNYSLFFLKSLVVLVSLLIHELGHAYYFKKFGIMSLVAIQGMGGVCIPLTPKTLTHWQSMQVSLAGPGANFLTAFFFWVFDSLTDFGSLSEQNGSLASTVYFVTLGWGIFNLLPIFPMDGGQALKSLLKHFRVKQAVLICLILSVSCLLGIGYFFLGNGSIITWLVLFYLGSDNYKLWKEYQSTRSRSY